MNKRPFLAMMLMVVSATAPAMAAPHPEGGGAMTNDDDPGINSQGMAINKLLKVLQVDPDSASDSCINALKEMHKSQDQLAAEEGQTSNQDVSVARDVVASDMEDVSTICGADARRLCRSPAAQKGKLPAACSALPDEGN